MGEIKAGIFDWGGVLIDNPAPELVRYCSRALGVLPYGFRVALEEHLPDFQVGGSEEVFWQRMCRSLEKDNIVGGNSLWGEVFRASYRPKDNVVGLVRELRRKGYKTGLLSNTERPAVDYFNELGWKEMFDAAIFSCDEGVRKPGEEIYNRALERLCVKPNEAVFIDDKLEYVLSSESIGIKGILFKSFEQLKKELAAFGII